MLFERFSGSFSFLKTKSVLSRSLQPHKTSVRVKAYQLQHLIPLLYSFRSYFQGMSQFGMSEDTSSQYLIDLLGLVVSFVNVTSLGQNHL